MVGAKFSMEGLAPTYQFCVDWRLSLESGHSTLMFLKKELESQPLDVQLHVRRYLSETGRSADHLTSISLHRRLLLELMSCSIKGEAVLSRVRELEKEIFLQCEHEIEKHLASLSWKLLLPMMLLMFPAFLILLLGPLMNHFVKGLQ